MELRPTQTTTMAMAETLKNMHADGVRSEPSGGGVAAARPLRRTVSNVTTDAEEVRRLRAQLQGMKEQVYFLHKMMQGLSGYEKQLLKGKHLHVENKRLSFAGISPVKKTRGAVDIIVMPEEKIPFADKWKLPTMPEHEQQSFLPVPEFNPSTGKETQLQSKLEALERENNALKEQMRQQAESFLSVEKDYRVQIEELTNKMIGLDQENAQLLSNIEAYEEENLRLHGALAQVSNDDSVDMDNNDNGANGEDTANIHDELGIDGLGEEPEDVHERCEAKIHELWQTIKTLKTYVETFRVEIEDLRVQRDNAMASAEKAWKENSKLAGNNNPQQKIKYLETVKKENAELIEKVRELQSKLAKAKLRRIDDKKGSGAGSEEEPSVVDSAEEPSDDGSDEERSKLIKKMWARNKKLEEEIDRLRKEKQELTTRQPRTRLNDSKKPVRSSSVSRWR